MANTLLASGPVLSLLTKTISSKVPVKNVGPDVATG